jgi:hypothetical protein
MDVDKTGYSYPYIFSCRNAIPPPARLFDTQKPFLLHIHSLYYDYYSIIIY